MIDKDVLEEIRELEQSTIELLKKNALGELRNMRVWCETDGCTFEKFIILKNKESMIEYYGHACPNCKAVLINDDDLMDWSKYLAEISIATTEINDRIDRDPGYAEYIMNQEYVITTHSSTDK